MKNEDWEKIKDIFAQVLELPADRRSAFLRRACGGDKLLQREIKSLLEAHDETEHFIEKKEFGAASVFDAASADYAGKQFGNYKILREIGRGGMGAVFLAERADGEFQHKVALKIVSRTFVGAELERRFRRERQILASLNHPNIAQLYDGGISAHGEPFLAMEYVEGVRIDEFCETNNLSVNERLKLFLAVCAAVSFAHQNLVVHRDLKPSNILVTAGGAVKLLDFGIAKLSGAEHADERTQTAFRVFTPEYASPEQLRGESVSTATDVYSLGIILYELLTTRRPFEMSKHSAEEIIQAVCNTEPRPPSAILDFGFRISDSKNAPKSTNGKTTNQTEQNTNPKFKTRNPKSLRGDLDNIVLKALKKEPSRRYSSVEQFAEDIRRHLSNLPVLARPDTISYRAAKFFNRNKIAVSAAALIFLTLIGGIVATFWQARRAEANRLRAEKRFADVRELSNALLNDIAPKIERLVGSTEARQSVVNQSLKYLDSLAGESTDDSALQAELAAAYEKVAELQGNPSKPNLGDFAGAILSYQKANRIRRSLPEARENQLLLAKNFRGLANVRNAENDVEGALRDYAEALKILETLLTKEPEADDLQTTYLETKSVVAELHSFNSQFDIAIPMLREIIQILERRDPNKEETRRFLALGYANLGYALSWDSKQAEAENEMEKAVKIANNLVAANPNDADIRFEVLRIYALKSGIHETINDEISLEFAHKALRLTEQAVERDATDARAKVNLAEMFSRVGFLSLRLKRFPEAVSNLEKSEKIYLAILERDPANRAYQEQLGKLYTRFGYVKETQGDLQGALRAFHKAVEYIEMSSIQGEKNNLLNRRDLAQTLQSAGKVYHKLGEKQKAKESFQKAFDILNGLKAQNALADWDNKMLDELREALQRL